MDTTKTVCYTMLIVGGVVVAHAILNEQYCVGHPWAHSCHNPIAPGPEQPHDLVTSSTSTGSVAITSTLILPASTT